MRTSKLLGLLVRLSSKKNAGVLPLTPFLTCISVNARGRATSTGGGDVGLATSTSTLTCAPGQRCEPSCCGHVTPIASVTVTAAVSLTCKKHTAQRYAGLSLGLWLRLECSLDSLSIDSAHVIYVSEGYDVAYNRRTASQPSHVVLRVTWYVKTFQKRKLRVLNPARINVFYWFNWLNLIGS